MLGVHFKGFMANNIEADCHIMRKIYEDGDPSLPMVGHEQRCIFHWYANLDKVTQKYIKSIPVISTQTCLQKLQGCQKK